ncbi:MAG: LytR family transcriptional regulator [Clostridiales bacterium]|nr:LytR family transcriptional regulator [Clostridiales bacterium]
MKRTTRAAKRLTALLCAALMLLAALPARAGEAETLNILLIGEDAAREGRNGRSDTMMLVQIAPESGAVKLVSFLRDLYVPIEGHGTQRLNAAYVHGGEALLRQTLTGLFGVRIDRTAKVDFAAMAALIDRLGGVELEISETERRALNEILEAYCRERALPYAPVETAGTVRLTGPQALSYSRVRSPDSDFVRVSRQQQVLTALLRQAMALEPVELIGLAVMCMNSIETDLGLSDLLTLLPLMDRDIDLAAAHVPFEGTCRDLQVDGMWVLESDIAENKKRLHAFLAEP